MPQNILIAGAPGLLASHLAASQLSRSKGMVYFTAPRRSDEKRFSDLVRLALIGRGGTTQGLSRLRLVNRNWDGAEPSQIWYFEDQKIAQHTEQLKRFAALSEEKINLVYSPFGGGGFSQWLMRKSVVEPSVHANPSDYRVFHVGMIIDKTTPANALSREGVVQIAMTLGDFKQEIQERLSDYFSRQPLRFRVPDDATVDIIRVEDAADLLSRFAEAPPAGSEPIYVHSGSPVRLSELFHELATVFQIRPVIVSNCRDMNPVDRLFEQRLRGLYEWLDARSAIGSTKLAEFKELSREKLVVTKRDREPLLADLCRSQEEQFRARDFSAEIQTSLLCKRIGPQSNELVYYVAGDGDRVIVLLNAIGQGHRYWIRLIESLVALQYKVLLWEPREVSTSTPPFRLSDQASDLGSVLAAEHIEHCSLVCWCTGAKTGIKFLATHPGITTALVLLNCTLKCFGGDSQFDSEYERNFETFCNLITKYPDMAPSVSTALLRSVTEKDPEWDDGVESEQFGRRVLALSNRYLREEKIRPFRDHATLVKYCAQIQGFWSHNSAPDIEQVNIPVFVVASELDSVVSLNGSQHIFRSFSNAEYWQIPGSTHYFMFDHPNMVAELIDIFVSGD